MSIVIPVYCEEETLPALFLRLTQVFPRKSRATKFEFIFVDDGSTDRSAELLRGFADADQRCRIVTLSRNFGHQSALLAGIGEAMGDAVVVMDADLQDPPELVFSMIDEWENGADIVYAKRRDRRGEGLVKRGTASLFYRLLDYLSDTHLPRDVGDFRLMDSVVVDHLTALNEKSLYLRGMSAWLGFTQTSVEFDRDPRYAGETKYSITKMVSLATDALLSFSEKPLRIVTRLGLLVTTGAFFWGVYLLLASAFTDHQNAAGWPSLILTVLGLGGVQLICLGIVGQYVSRVYREVKGRPLYIIDRRKSTPR